MVGSARRTWQRRCRKGASTLSGFPAVVVPGPNLNLRGSRELGIDGATTLADLSNVPAYALDHMRRG